VFPRFGNHRFQVLPPEVVVPLVVAVAVAVAVIVLWLWLFSVVALLVPRCYPQEYVFPPPIVKGHGVSGKTVHDGGYPIDVQEAPGDDLVQWFCRYCCRCRCRCGCRCRCAFDNASTTAFAPAFVLVVDEFHDGVRQADKAGGHGIVVVVVVVVAVVCFVAVLVDLQAS